MPLSKVWAAQLLVAVSIANRSPRSFISRRWRAWYRSRLVFPRRCALYGAVSCSS